MKINLINEVGLSDSDLFNFVAGLTKHAKKVTDAYKIEAAQITGTTFFGNSETGLVLDKSTPRVIITERNRRGALAWRDLDANGTPIVYASLKASVKPYGVYRKPFVLKGRTINPARMRSGLISVLAHEISELLVSPMMNNFTPADSTGKSWRKEICDPVLGAYYFENINGIDCVFPDFVLPSFWDAQGQAPYSYLGTAKAAMTWAPGSYAWFRTTGTKLTRIQF